jgi:AraC-like DNA-binding protein
MDWPVLLVVNFFGLALGLVAFGILIFSNKTHLHANRLLATCILGLTILMAASILRISGYLLYFPHLFRVASPVFYLVMPAAYLYVRAVVCDETKFKKADALNLIPAVLHLFELVPYYFKSSAEKAQQLQELIANSEKFLQLNEGLLPPYFHNILRSLLGIFYLILMIKLLWKEADIQNGEYHLADSIAFSWLKTFTFFMGLIIVPAAIILLSPLPAGFNRYYIISLSISLTFAVTVIYLYFRPEILYGIPRTDHVQLNYNGISPKTSNEEQEVATDQIEEEALMDEVKSKEVAPPKSRTASHSALKYLDPYKPILENYLESASPFLKHGYSLRDLSKATKIAPHHLSALLNKVYGKRFNDFINQYRLDYIRKNAGKPEWQQLTLEGIAWQAGFQSRTTFFHAIKRSTGLSPSEFMKQVRDEAD